MLKIQEFIGCFDNIDKAHIYLRANAGVDAVLHNVSDDDGYVHDLFLYKPTKNADMNNPLVREAHCLIMNDRAELLSKAWDYPLDVKTEKDFPGEFSFTRDTFVSDQMDGEIVVIYNLEGRWVIGTPNSADTWNDAVDKVSPSYTWDSDIKALLSGNTVNAWDVKLKELNPFMCLVFSYVSPHNTKVMPILKPSLTLLACINTETGKEFPTSMVTKLSDKLNMSMTDWHPISGSTAISVRLNRMRTLSPGVILCDNIGHRLMIHNPIYKAVKSALDAGERCRPVHVVKILQSCRDKLDAMTIGRSYPDFEPMLKLLQEVRLELLSELHNLWEMVEPLALAENVKEFAEVVQYHPLNHLLFMLKDKKIISFGDEVDKLKPIKLAALAREKHEKEYESAAALLKFVGGNKNGNKEESSEEKGPF